ncbi:MAG: DUF4493 domain-containing protein [Clostridiales bacterium]|nr:DUF4493 domain-containing protein [Clostridiales bacterium]
MKKAIFYSLVSSGILLMTGCNETWNSALGGEGSIVPIVDLDTETVSSRGEKQARSNAGSISVEDLKLTLTSTKDGSKREWKSVSEFDATEKFDVGTYTLEASYGQKNDDGFEKPFYYGVTSVPVRDNETTNVALTASLANSMLSIKYSEAFVGYFNDYSVDVKTVNATTTYSRNENRPVYVTPGSVTLAINVVKPNGVAQTFTATVTAKAKYHHNVTLDVNGGNVGDAVFTISFDDTLEQEDIMIDLSKDLTNTPAPTLKGDGFENGGELTTVQGVLTENPITMTVMARGGISSLKLTTVSTSLIEKGWPKEVELIGTPSATRTTMTSLGFVERGVWQNPDQMAVIDLSNVITNIGYITGFDNRSSFTLEVTDRLGQTAEQELSFSVVVEKLQLDITSGEAYDYSSRGTIDVEYNGANPETTLAFEAMNGRGVYQRLKLESVEAKSRAMQSYTATVDGFTDDLAHGSDPIKVKAVVIDKTGNAIESSGEFTITRQQAPFSMNLSENNVFATRAFVGVEHENLGFADFVKGAKLLVSADNGASFNEYTYTIEGENLRIDGLKANTVYLARIVADGKSCRPVQFTTEDALQLANAGLNDGWTIPNKGNHWKEYAVNGWATMNPRTVSSKNGTDETTYAYVATSGTVPTDDSKSGKAALIRTVGWGSGNTAPANFIIKQDFGKCNNATAGELYLGSYDNGANYGTDFPSRPSSVAFSYKYIKKNEADRGLAIIRVRDNAGNVISENEMVIDSQGSSYIDDKLTLDYALNSSKASVLEVTFKSSNADVNSLRNKEWLTPPPHNNLGAGEYVGSQLYIDDITLNY